MVPWSLMGSKVGDLVAVSNRSLFEKRTITKATATQITLDDGTRWLRRNGRKVGSGTWSSLFVRPWDEEEHVSRLHEAELRMLRRKVDEISAARLTSDQCARILAIAAEVTQ
jgi:hypothetical protein